MRSCSGGINKACQLKQRGVWRDRSEEVRSTVNEGSDEKAFASDGMGLKRLKIKRLPSGPAASYASDVPSE